MMITKEEIVQTVDGLSQPEYQSRIRTIPSFDEGQLAAPYSESAEQDRKLAEEGMSDYTVALAQEDAG